MKIDFYLRFHTRFGQSLSITGNHPALGNNNQETALVMRFINEDFWHASIEVADDEKFPLRYRYLFIDEKGEVIAEAEKERVLSFEKRFADSILVIDTWNYGGSFENAFFTAPFRNVLLPQDKKIKSKATAYGTHTFKVKGPQVTAGEVVCILGSGAELKYWDTADPVLLSKEGEWWTAKIDMENAAFPLTYKYGIFNTRKQEFVRFEEGNNRILFGSTSGAETVLHDGFIRLPNTSWKGAGLAIPVFSLKSKDSFGIGEFADLKLLADWAATTGLKLIQLLPINDTTATSTWRDSYPYAAISAFALHPLYINLQKVAGKKGGHIIKALSKKRKQLNDLEAIDYEQVLRFKINTLRELYELDENNFKEEDSYQTFFEANRHWLVPYAAFCFLRDKYGTSEFHQWKTYSAFDAVEINRLCAPKSKQYKQIAFWFFVQYHLHLQLKDAVKYAHKKGIVLKGDIPIGVYRNGCDAWMYPNLYHLDQQAGAPPDDFAVKGQNWGFPTYNWQNMQQDNFEWWRLRFHQMSHYFDAFRIDHILGFFRIWSIPAHAVEGIMGVFVPAVPLAVTDFAERGIWFNYERYCKPYITDVVLGDIFHQHTEFVKQTFLEKKDNGSYDLLENFSTQQKVEAFFAAQDNTDENKKIKQGLFDLISNVILFEEAGSNKQLFHFRISIEHTSSYHQLDDREKGKLWELYIHYFYHRHDDLWRKEALKKLPALKEATNMLVCGEDLGMVPHAVPHVMQGLGILSLEIQRMPKDLNTEFFHPRHAPYLSVVTPSTHDMSTIRGWWEEDRARTQRFFNTILQENGGAPFFCEPWINLAIVMQHLYSPAMWCIFQLQDVLGINGKLRRSNPNDERINVPANAHHYWRYRMHLSLEELMNEKEFGQQLKELIEKSGRA